MNKCRPLFARATDCRWLCSNVRAMFSCATAAACGRSVGNVAALLHLIIGTHVSTEWPDDTRQPKKTSPSTSWLRNTTERKKKKGKGKVHPRTGHEGPEGQKKYSSTLSLTSVLDGVGGQRHAPAALPPGKSRYPLYGRLGGPHGRSGRVRKISPPTGIWPPIRPARR